MDHALRVAHVPLETDLAPQVMAHAQQAMAHVPQELVMAHALQEQELDLVPQEQVMAHALQEQETAHVLMDLVVVAQEATAQVADSLLVPVVALVANQPTNAITVVRKKSIKTMTTTKKALRMQSHLKALFHPS